MIHTTSIGGIPRYSDVLVELEVTGPAVNPAMNFPATLPEKPTFLADLRNPNQIDGYFVLELNPRTHLNRELWSTGEYYR